MSNRLAVLVLALALPLFGGQSLQRATGDTMSFTPPDSAPWTALGAHRVEVVATINSCSATSSFWKVGGFHAFCSSSNNIWLTTPGDSGSESIAGMTDVLIRIQRDPAQTLDSSNDSIPVAHLEIWNADGSGRVYQRTNDNSSTIDASSLQTWNIGTSDIEFHSIKVFSSLVEVGVNAPLPDPHDVGDLANWDFEGALTDSGPDGMDFSASGTAFGATPTNNPVADPAVDADPFWMQAPSVRAGAEVALSAARSISFDDVDGLTCVWSDQGGGSGPTAILFTGSTTACETTAVFPTYGDYDLRLVVTDDGALTDTADITVGAVATDDNRIVVMDDDAFALALGEQIQWGKSAWPFLPNRWYAMADYNKGILDPAWETKGTGTVSVTNGSPTVTGSGTNFQVTYCGGGSTPTNSAFVITDDNGINWLTSITACNSATSLTMANNWNKASDSGLAYSFWASLDVTDWINGSENWNYYDNVWAFYALCKTSGFQWACEGARALAQAWWSMPYMVEGQAPTGPRGNSGVMGDPRRQSLIGIMLWAHEQGTEAAVFPGVEDIIQYFDGLWVTHPLNYCMIDPREAWYVGMWLTLAQELDTDPTRISGYQSILTAAMDASGGVSGGELDPDLCRFPSGGWVTPGSAQYTNAGTGTVSVTNGSPTISCDSTCGWTAGDVGKYVQIGVLNNKDRQSDVGQYEITAQDSGSLTVTPNFAGTTGSGRFYFIRAENTYMHQALSNAMPNIALGWQYEAGISDYREAIVETFDYIEDKLYWPAKKGVYNLTDEDAYCTFAQANLISAESSDGSNCQYSESRSASGQRFLTMELVAALTNGVKYGRQIDDANTATRVALVDEMMGAAMGALGGPDTDTTWATEYDDDSDQTFSGGLGSGNGKQKNFGFCCGVGGAGTWDAERLGGLAPEDLVDYGIPLDIGSVSGATKATCTLYEPRGFSRAVSDQTGSSCTVTGDERQGDHLAVITYRDAMNNVVGVDSLMVTAGALNEPAVQVTGTLGGSFTIQ